MSRLSLTDKKYETSFVTFASTPHSWTYPSLASLSGAMFAVTIEGTINCPENMIFLNPGMVTLLISIENSSTSLAGGLFFTVKSMAYTTFFSLALPKFY